jgi:hypothetical protein
MRSPPSLSLGSFSVWSFRKQRTSETVPPETLHYGIFSRFGGIQVPSRYGATGKSGGTFSSMLIREDLVDFLDEMQT